LAFSYWIDYLGFTTEGRLAAVLIIPSLGVPNWSVIYIINTAPSAGHRFGRKKWQFPFCPRFLSTPIKLFMVSACILALIGAIFFAQNHKLVVIIWFCAFYGYC
jgi:hypothetical protein